MQDREPSWCTALSAVHHAVHSCYTKQPVQQQYTIEYTIKYNISTPSSTTAVHHAVQQQYLTPTLTPAATSSATCLSGSASPEVERSRLCTSSMKSWKCMRRTCRTCDKQCLFLGYRGGGPPPADHTRHTKIAWKCMRRTCRTRDTH
jgi:hypothetical protein